MNKKDSFKLTRQASKMLQMEIEMDNGADYFYDKLQVMAFAAVGVDSMLDLELTLFRMTKRQLAQFQAQMAKMQLVVDAHLEKRADEAKGYPRRSAISQAFTTNDPPMGTNDE